MKSTYRELERIVKGFSNHRRIQMLELLDRRPGLTVGELTSAVGSRFRAVSEHLRRMAIAGVVVKRNRGREVEHRLTRRGVKALAFLRAAD